MFPVKMTVLLVDGMAYVYRAFYAIPPMAAPDGTPTNAVFGFVRMVQRMVDAAAPDAIAVAFDTKEPTFRHKRYEQYKAQRPPMPPDLASQVPWVKEYLAALGILCIECPGFEADDIIGTLARRAEAQEAHTLIASSDKDLCQLVSPRIAILSLGTRECEVVDEAGVHAKFGVHPGQIVDYLALVGDSSDNVPGVPGIGPKTAQVLLREHGTLDALYGRLDALRPAVRAALEQVRDRIGSLRELLAVCCNAPVDQTVEDLLVHAPQEDRLARLREHLGFRPAGAQAPASQAAKAQPQPELF